MKTVEGTLHQASKLRVAVIAARFNALVVDPLVAGAHDTLVRHGVRDDNITLYKVPGAFEIPMLAKKLAGSGQYDAVLALGAVIRGATPHFDHVCNQAAAGVMKAGLETQIPVVFGVLTTDTIEQAMERAGSKAGNKGADAALTAIEMCNLLESL